MKRICSFPGCGRPHVSRGHCSAHAQQMRKTGRTVTLRADRPDAPIGPRILAKAAEDASGCLVWAGTVMKNGYGQISWHNRLWLVHRAIWTETVGPIPDKLTVDHLCRNRACVNVLHMEIVTLAENANRGGGLSVAWERRAAKTHCKRGHEFTPENTRLTTQGSRQCRACHRVLWREWAVRAGLRKPLDNVGRYLDEPAVAS